MSYRGQELFEQQLTAELRRCRPYIEAALQFTGGTHEWEDIVYLVRKRTAQFWPGKNCAVITELVDTPGLRYCGIWLAGGELEELKEVERNIALWAREQGARKVIIRGRPGWEKVLEGYRRAYVALEKDLAP